MNSLAVAPSRPFFPLSRPARYALAVLVLIVLADWLFFDSRRLISRFIGLSVPLFLLAVGFGCALGNRWGLSRRGSMAAFALLIVALFPLVEAPGQLGFGFGLIGLGAFALIMAGRRPDRLAGWFRAIFGLYCAGPWRFLKRLLHRRNRSWAERQMLRGFGRFSIWVVPLVLGGVFLALFASANPLIGAWFIRLDGSSLIDAFDGWRVMFWGVILVLTMPLLHVLPRRRKPARAFVRAGAPEASPHAMAGGRKRDTLLSSAAILRSLLVFNLLFAMQSAMDLVYLWGGVTLPHGMTYATYAHDGAYPLMLTALLAGAFVLVALKPGSEAAGSPVIRRLVYLWIGQTILLVVSAIFRLDLYVATYSLSWWRLSALIWMGLVTVGLALILWRIAKGASNAWLVRANLIVAGLVLYGCSVANFDRIIANYNVDHSYEMTGQGRRIDRWYLYRLGPEVIPALDRLIAACEARQPQAPDSVLQSLDSECNVIPRDDPSYYSSANLSRLKDWRNELAREALREKEDWRAWSFRQARLWRYLDETERARSPRVLPDAK